MSEVVEEEKRQKALDALGSIIREFLAGRYSNIMLRFNEFLYLSEDEYLKLFGTIDSSGGADDVDVFFYVSDASKDPKFEICLLTIKALEIRLEAQENDVYVIHEVRGHTNVKEVSCKEKGE